MNFDLMRFDLMIISLFYDLSLALKTINLDWMGNATPFRNKSTDWSHSGLTQLSFECKQSFAVWMQTKFCHWNVNKFCNMINVVGAKLVLQIKLNGKIHCYRRCNYFILPTNQYQKIQKWENNENHKRIFVFLYWLTFSLTNQVTIWDEMALKCTVT